MKRTYLRQSRVQYIPMTSSEKRQQKIKKKMSVRRTNTFQSISPRTVVFHVPLTRSNPLLIPTPFVCLPIFVGRAISPDYFSISFDESTSVRVPLPLRAFFSSSMSNSGWHKFDKFLLFSISVACEQRLQSSPRIPLRGRGRSLGRSNTTGRER